MVQGKNKQLYDLAKRLVDIIGSLAGLIITAPLNVLIGIAVRLDTPGPALFRQTRVGRGGEEFVMMKFRTMLNDNDPSAHRDYYRRLIGGEAESRVDADGEPLFLLNDPRLTRVGRVLRKASLDELPNLINVLLGSMSLVGPRPPIPYEVEMYDERALGRLAVKPGMTGLAQISGRGRLTFQEIVDKDLEYIEKRSMWMDLVLMLQTIPAVLKTRGV
jgi:lipopolysaccharide/colanic/teichoic acid biosynthesis glycosyltransferase